MSDHIDGMCKISSSRSQEYNYRVVIDDIKKTVEDFPNEKRLVCNYLKIPLKYSSLPGHIELYPSGDQEENKEYMSVYIYLKPNTDAMDDIPVKVAITIIHANGKSGGYKFERKLSAFKNGRGICKFIRYSDLFDVSKNLLKNGGLTLAFKIILPQNDTVIKSNYFAGDRVADYKDHSELMNKLHQGFMSDFIIVTAGQDEVPCHMHILAANSDYFEGMLSRHDSKERQEGRVELKELEKENCQTILKYLYTGILEEKDATMQLYKDADSLEFLQLKEVLSSHLCKYISKENCIPTFLLADGTNDENLKMAAADCINDNEEKFKNLEQDIKDLKLLRYLHRRLAKRIKLA